MTWSDAVLTPLGISQASAVNVAFKNESAQGCPLPQSIYTSPMRRALQTANITWGDLVINQGITPMVSLARPVDREGRS
jgi:broad specificity phosphatase PhoE